MNNDPRYDRARAELEDIVRRHPHLVTPARPAPTYPESPFAARARAGTLPGKDLGR